MGTNLGAIQGRPSLSNWTAGCRHPHPSVGLDALSDSLRQGHTSPGALDGPTQHSDLWPVRRRRRNNRRRGCRPATGEGPPPPVRWAGNRSDQAQPEGMARWCSSAGHRFDRHPPDELFHKQGGRAHPAGCGGVRSLIKAAVQHAHRWPRLNPGGIEPTAQGWLSAGPSLNLSRWCQLSRSRGPHDIPGMTAQITDQPASSPRLPGQTPAARPRSTLETHFR